MYGNILHSATKKETRARAMLFPADEIGVAGFVPWGNSLLRDG
jgi:hypothetical protein